MRIQQRVTYFLLSHRWLSLIGTFLVSFLPVISVAGILYAGFATLRKGIYEGGMLALAATLPYLISFYLMVPDQNTQFVLWFVVGIAVVSNLLTFVFAVMLRRHATWSQILQVAALVGVLVISVIHLVYPDIVNWWGMQLTQLANNAKPDPAINPEMITAAINSSKEVTTGFITTIVLLNALLQLVVCRWWQAKVYSQGLLRRELHNIRLSSLAGFLFAVSLALCYYGNSVIMDIMPVLYLLFAVAGLSVLHYLFGLMKSGTRVFWMLLMYVVLIFILPTSIYVLVLIGVTDIWLDIRKRLNKASI